MEESDLTQLQNLRQLFANAVPDDRKRQEQYAWIVCKGIDRNAEELGALMCRQLLADVMRLPLERPSKLYSAILWSATKVASLFTDFHFVPFLNMWDPQHNLREDDYKDGTNKDGVRYSSLVERMVKATLLAMLIRPQEKPTYMASESFGYHPIKKMIVSKVSQAEVKGRKMWFATLFGNDGEELFVETHTLRRSPLQQYANDRHYVNVGQMYDVVLKDKQDKSGVRLVDAVLSTCSVEDSFPVSIGYVEYKDTEHDHIHIYDSQSRHFVSSGQRFVKAEKGQMVMFVPIIPKDNPFKSAIIIPTTAPQSELLNVFPVRKIRVVSINTEKNYCAWELKDASVPIAETLSPLQISKGETSPSFIGGFMNLDMAKSVMPNIAQGAEAYAVIFLKRGKDKQKRPYVAKIFG